MEWWASQTTGKNYFMKICIPTLDDQGLDSLPYSHFGSAPCIILHDATSGDTKVIHNRNEHHEHGKCNPLRALDGEKVEVVIVGGIGRRAFARLHQAGIRVFQATDANVRENLRKVIDGRLTEFTLETACHGSDHRHAPRQDITPINP